MQALVKEEFAFEIPSATGLKLDRAQIPEWTRPSSSTKDNDRVHLPIALNYRSRDEVARATNTWPVMWRLESLNPDTATRRRWARFISDTHCSWARPQTSLIRTQRRSAGFSNVSALASPAYVNTIFASIRPLAWISPRLFCRRAVGVTALR